MTPREEYKASLKLILELARHDLVYITNNMVESFCYNYKPLDGQPDPQQLAELKWCRDREMELYKLIETIKKAHDAVDH